MSILSEQEISDCSEILRLHDEAFRDYLERHDYGHKSHEGAIQLLFGNFWDRDGWDNPGDPGTVGVSIYSYALGPSRQHYFDTISDGLAAMRQWHKGQMEAPDD